MIKKTKQRKSINKIKPSKLYSRFDKHIFNNPGPLILLFVLSLFIGGYFWFSINGDGSISQWNNHGINNWILGIGFFILWELLYVWICKNDSHIHRDDIALAKFMSCLLIYLITALIIPGIYFVIQILIGVDWKALFQFIGYGLMIVFAIIIGGWLFYKLNVLIFDKIRGNK